ncbi:MBL fold metallo-hydrolase [Clostridium saccharoperbutylacetonicum]
MKIANGVEILELAAKNMKGEPTSIYPILICDKETVVLVDAGYPGQLEQIRKEVEKTGVKFETVNMVLITHHDIDHIGSLASIVNELPEVKVLCHEEEKAYIEGVKQPHKLAMLEANLDNLSQEMKGFYEHFKVGFEKARTKVDRTLKDGEELHYCGGITIIYTPGHTMGHSCLYFKESKTLIAGDILMVKDGVLVKAPYSINFDDELCLKSLKKLMQYDIENVVCYHGGIYNSKVNERIKELTDAAAQ